MKLTPTIVFYLSVFFNFTLAGEKKVVFVAGAKSHGFCTRTCCGCKLLAKHIEEAKIGITTKVVTDSGYPKDSSVFDDADAVVVACDGGLGIC